MRIYLHAWFGFKNVGDDLLCKEIVSVLFSLTCVDKISVGVAESGYLKSFIGESQKVDFVERTNRGLFGKALSHDALMVGPGGIFPHSDVLKVFVYFCVVLFWKALGRKVLFFGFGANRQQNRFAAFLWRAIAHRADLFITRDDLLFESCGIKRDWKTYSGVDVVFLKQPQTELGPCVSGISKRRVAVALANVLEESDPMYEEFLGSCTEFCSALNVWGCAVDLLSFTAEVDERFNREVARGVQGGDIVVLSYEETLCVADQFSSYDLVVGMRFHAVVLSILAGIPCIGIAYSDKTEKLLFDMGQGEHVLLFCGCGGGYYGRAISLDVASLLRFADEALNFPDRYIVPEKIVTEYSRRAKTMVATLCEVLDGTGIDAMEGSRCEARRGA